jgi:hypothetical protein
MPAVNGRSAPVAAHGGRGPADVVTFPMAVGTWVFGPGRAYRMAGSPGLIG